VLVGEARPRDVEIPFHVFMILPETARKGKRISCPFLFSSQNALAVLRYFWQNRYVDD
jgi:hypothetical protein